MTFGLLQAAWVRVLVFSSTFYNETPSEPTVITPVSDSEPDVGFGVELADGWAPTVPVGSVSLASVPGAQLLKLDHCGAEVSFNHRGAAPLPSSPVCPAFDVLKLPPQEHRGAPHRF